MQKLHLEMDINSDINKVWNTVIGKTTYPIWAKAFDLNSDVEGEWKEGEKLHFVGGEKKEFGMVSILEKVTEPTFISIRHIGQLKDGVEDLTSEEVKKWSGMHENYTLVDKGGITTFHLDMDIDEEYYEMMKNMWVIAIGRLKLLCEKGEILAINIQADVKADIEKVWDMWTSPMHITKWAFADPSWEAPSAVNNLEVHGRFSTRMQERANPQNGFEFGGVYAAVEKPNIIKYFMDDGRFVDIVFTQNGEIVHISQTFDAEQMNSPELQRSGWQSILDNFKKYVEAN